MLATVLGHFGCLATAPQGGAGGLSNDLLSSGLVAAGVMMLVWLLLRMQWRRQGRGERTPLEHMTDGHEQLRPAVLPWIPPATPSHPNRPAAAGSRRDEEAGAELVQLARRILAQVEARSAQLEALIADADERIAELRRLEERHPALQDGGAPRPGGGASGAARPPAREPDHPAGGVTREVYALADRGLAPVEIARELDQHLGSVELILALRPK